MLIDSVDPENSAIKSKRVDGMISFISRVNSADMIYSNGSERLVLDFFIPFI